MRVGNGLFAGNEAAGMHCAKKELLRIPIFGWALRLLRPISLDRSKPARALKQVLTQGVARLGTGLSVLIFPEGTRVDPGVRKRYNKSGSVVACRAGVPVLPVAHNAGERWPGRHWVKQPGVLRVRIGAPIETHGVRLMKLLPRWKAGLRVSYRKFPRCHARLSVSGLDESLGRSTRH